MPKASARHILVSTKEACEDLKTQIEGGADFARPGRQALVLSFESRGAHWASFRPAKWCPSSIAWCSVLRSARCKGR